MFISQVVLSNIGPHKNLVVDFADGLTGIIGANGAGKSTLVNAIYAAITGDFTRLGPTKADAIHNDDDGHSFIELRGHHNGQEFFVHRGLRPNKVVIRFGEESVKSTKAANEELLARLNVPKAVIDSYVFVDQWSMFGFLDQRESERAKVLQYLSRTEHAEVIYKSCNAFISQHSSTNVLDNSLELMQTIDQQKKQMADVEAEGKRAAAMILPDERDKQLRDQVQAYNQFSSLQSDIEKTTTRMVKLQDGLQPLEDSLVTLEEKIAESKLQVSDLRQKSEMARSRLNSFKSIRMCVEELERDKKDLSKLIEKFKSLSSERTAALKAAGFTENQIPAALQEKAELQHEVSHLQREIQEREKLADNLGSDLGSDTCSRCGQTLNKDAYSRLVSEIQGMKQKLEDARSRLKLLVSLSKVNEDLEKSGNDGKAAKAKYLASKQRHEQLAGSVKADETEEDCRAIIQKYSDAQEKLDSLMESFRDITKTVENKKGGIETERTNIAHYEKQLEKVQKLLEDAGPREELYEALRVSDQAKQDRRAAVQTYTHLRATLQSTEKLLSDLREKLERHKDVQKRLEVVKRVADVFHWQSLPKAVSNANLRLLQSDINNTLSLFKDPFVVEATDELMFQAFFPGRPGISAKQLSGGQKVVLASAFRIALDRLFDVGILLLDEPTAGLDADNVAYFHDALQVMSESLKGRKQVIVITHLHEYCDKFDAVVEL
jgi:exonuclease SbcC